MVILLAPSLRARLSVKLPSDSAVPAMDDPFAALCAMSVVRACVLPLMSTALLLTMALFFGEAIVILGGTLSKT